MGIYLSCNIPRYKEAQDNNPASPRAGCGSCAGTGKRPGTRLQLCLLLPTLLPTSKISLGVFCPGPLCEGNLSLCRRRCEGVCERAGRRARGGERHPGCCTSGWVSQSLIKGGPAVPHQSPPAPRPTFGPCRLEGTLSPRRCLQCG